MEDLWRVDPKLALEVTSFADENGNVTITDIPAHMAKRIFVDGLVGGKKLSQIEAYSL